MSDAGLGDACGLRARHPLSALGERTVAARCGVPIWLRFRTARGRVLLAEAEIVRGQRIAGRHFGVVGVAEAHLGEGTDQAQQEPSSSRGAPVVCVVTHQSIVLKSDQQWCSEITGNGAQWSAMVLNTCRAVVFLLT